VRASGVGACLIDSADLRFRKAATACGCGWAIYRASLVWKQFGQAAYERYSVIRQLWQILEKYLDFQGSCQSCDSCVSHSG
jgi:hypothetical protein